jgi:uncharacterized protein YbcI
VTEAQTERGQEFERDGSVLMGIANELVLLFKEQFGRGPTAARAAWAGPDVITVILEQTLTRADKNLVEMGEHERLREMRSFFQYASVREFCEPVERLTGRRVRAFISGIDTEADGLSVETFVLHPEGSDEPSRIERAEP